MEEHLKPLHLACVADDLRPNMRLIEIKNGIAQATNGTILVKIQLIENSKLTPEQIELLNGKFIDMEVWKECHKCDILEIEPDNIICHKNGIKKIFEYSQSQGTFFNLDSIIDNLKSKHSEAKDFVYINAKFIDMARKIFEENSIHFAFSEGDSPILLYPYEGCGMFAVIMPMMATEVQNRYFFRT